MKHKSIHVDELKNCDFDEYLKAGEPNQRYRLTAKGKTIRLVSL